jgi:3-oxoacyl-[acyl-carrier protein] reductase
MDLGIKGRVAFVGASSKGLGLSVAESLAAEGASLAMCARGEEALGAAAQGIRDRFGVDVVEQALDVTDFEAVTKFMNETRNRLGNIDICVTNAGGPPGGTFEDFSLEDWRKAFELTFLSTLHMIREVLPGMRKQRWGRVVTVTSVSTKQTIDSLILSNAIRASVVGLMKSLVREYGGDNVLFNNVCPGAHATDRLLKMANLRAEKQGVSADEVIAGMSREVPLQRVGQPQEFGPLVAFLCSQKASYITGASVPIDGGQVRGV